MATMTAEAVTERVDLAGTTALVTGGSSGLGEEVARVMALRGARVIIAARDVDKAQSKARAMRGDVEVRTCELRSMASVAACADALVADGIVVDRLFLNAGVFGLPYARTDEGHERTFAANYLGHFALLHRLLRAHALSDGARVIATLSEGVVHPFAKVDLAWLEAPSERGFSTSRASPTTKILLALALTELARRDPTVTPLFALPAATLTDNVNQGPRWLRPVGRAIGPLFFAPVERGAAVLAWAAASPEVARGKAYGKTLRAARLPAKCTDPVMSRRVWDTTERVLALPPWPTAVP